MLHTEHKEGKPKATRTYHWGKKRQNHNSPANEGKKSSYHLPEAQKKEAGSLHKESPSKDLQDLISSLEVALRFKAEAAHQEDPSKFRIFMPANFYVVLKAFWAEPCTQSLICRISLDAEISVPLYRISVSMTDGVYEEEYSSSSEDYSEESSDSEYEDASVRHRWWSHQHKPIRIHDRWAMHSIKKKKDDYAEGQRSRPPSKQPITTSVARLCNGIPQTPKESFNERLKRHAELNALDPRRSRWITDFSKDRRRIWHDGWMSMLKAKDVSFMDYVYGTKAPEVKKPTSIQTKNVFIITREVNYKALRRISIH